MIPFGPAWWKLRSFKKRLIQQSNQAVEATKKRWVGYVRSEGVSNELLGSHMRVFVTIVLHDLIETYPVLVIHPEMVRQIIATAIAESGTHSPQLISTAYAETDDLFQELFIQLRNWVRAEPS